MREIKGNLKEIKDLLTQLLKSSKWNVEELNWLMKYLNDSNESELKIIMKEQFTEENGLYILNLDKSKEILENIHASLGIKRKSSAGSFNVRFFKITIAASFIGLLGLLFYLWQPAGEKHIAGIKKEVVRPYENDVMPGGNKAVLTLADKSVIILNDTKDGELSQQGNTKIIKLNGKIAYDATGPANEILYNTVTTPLGGQYQVQLPDGSQVWLNAASSLRFPTIFTGKERKVEITGEAYFEVAKNDAVPFVVKVKDAEIQVLGTHFNVMAYGNEEVLKTTLLEGSVKFVKNGHINTLKPGQQSQLSTDGKVKIFDNVDVEVVMAWKNGLFHFQGQDIGTVLRQLIRWYDIEIVYKKTVDDLFYAEIPRNTKLSEVLKALELTGKVHFQINGKKVTVMP